MAFSLINASCEISQRELLEMDARRVNHGLGFAKPAVSGNNPDEKGSCGCERRKLFMCLGRDVGLRGHWINP